MDLTAFLPQFGGFAFTIAAFIVALSVIVAVHEYGHYIVGRWTGIHAEVFSLGFGPILFSRVDRHGTRWQVAALPLGGYVKFLGDANAASVGGDASGLSAAERRRTMLGAPLWARALTVAAGPAFNFFFAIAIFAGITLSEGRPTPVLTVASFPALPEGYVQDLRVGDEILSIAGQELAAPDGFALDLGDPPVAPSLEYRIRRDGVEQVVQGPYPFAPVVASVSPDSAARDVDMREGDVILSVNGTPVTGFTQVVDAVMTSDGRPQTLVVWRGGEELTFVVTPRRVDQPLPDGSFETRWLIGLTSGLIFEPLTEMPGLWSSLTQASAQVWFIVTSSISGLGHMISGAISTCSISGPVGIAQASGAMASDGAQSFVWFLAMLSAAVGLMNLFPVPILDGGHLVFHAWEAVTGRPPSDGALRILMSVGLSLILTLMVFALANDLFLCP